MEAAFSEGFAIARDPTSFLRLAHVPFEALSRRRRAAGAAAGGNRRSCRCRQSHAASRRRVVPLRSASGADGFKPPRLRFVYFDGHSPRALKLSEVRA